MEKDIGERSKKQNNRSLGSWYERNAAEYLRSQGFEISEVNFRSRFGEIDIIARDCGCIVFCEVKYRSSGERGGPLEAVGKNKQRHIARCARAYLNEKKIANVPCRFDVIGILGNRITHIKNAFLCDDGPICL